MSSGVLALLNENTASSLKNKDIVADLALLSLSLGGLFISLEIKDLSANKP